MKRAVNFVTKSLLCVFRSSLIYWRLEGFSSMISCHETHDCSLLSGKSLVFKTLLLSRRTKGLLITKRTTQRRDWEDRTWNRQHQWSTQFVQNTCSNLRTFEFAFTDHIQVLSDGSLFIETVSTQDFNWKFRCFVKDRLSGDVIPSSSWARLLRNGMCRQALLSWRLLLEHPFSS